MIILGCKGKQKGKGVPIGNDGLRTCALEMRQIIVKELMYGV